MVISVTGILLYAKVSPLYIVLWECILVVYTEIAAFTNILTHECTLGHQSLSVCVISDTYPLGCLRYTAKYGKDILISCGCVLLFTNKQFRCKHSGDWGSTWAMFDDHTYHWYPVICKSKSTVQCIV